MRVTTSLTATFFALVVAGFAQTRPERVVVKNPSGPPAYAVVFPKPQYPYELRSRRVGGTGVFALRIRRDGTVSSMETQTSTGHIELDNAAKNAFIKWRFEPGPTEARIPITFTPPHAGRAEWPFAR